jgi:1-acyl-sn-glycerol-3-phosphate acyltransferase
MTRVRAAAKLAAFFLTTIPLFGAFLVTRVLLTPFRGVQSRVGGALVSWWARVAASCVGMRVSVEGVAPTPPFFLVANHLSYLDVIALLTRVRGTFLAKSDIAHWPLLGLLARGVGTLFVDRTRKRDLVRISDLLRRELLAGQGIVVFPEATSSSGDAVLPFKPSTFEVPLELGIPVRCAALHYETPAGSEPARTSVCWWGDMKFVPHLWKMAALPNLTARIRFAAEPITGADRKVLASSAHATVTALHAALTARTEDSK